MKASNLRARDHGSSTLEKQRRRERGLGTIEQYTKHIYHVMLSAVVVRLVTIAAAFTPPNASPVMNQSPRSAVEQLTLHLSLETPF